MCIPPHYLNCHDNDVYIIKSSRNALGVGSDVHAAGGRGAPPPVHEGGEHARAHRICCRRRPPLAARV